MIIYKRKFNIKFIVLCITFLIIFSFALNIYNLYNTEEDNKQNSTKTKSEFDDSLSTTISQKINPKDLKTKLLIKDNIYLSKKNNNNNNKEIINEKEEEEKKKQEKLNNNDNNDNDNRIKSNLDISNLNGLNTNIKNLNKKFYFKKHLQHLEEIANIKKGNCLNVDIVYTWVNGSDPEHIKSKNKERGIEDFEPHRFRDYGSLKYSLRSVKMYAPWVHNIYIVTANQIPTWFNTSNSENIKFIFHQDFYRNKSHLPTFNSNSIESNFGNLPKEVSNCFLYLNDDVFFRVPVKREDYFDKYGNQQIYERSREYVSYEYSTAIKDSYSNQFVYTNIELSKVWNDFRSRTYPDHGVQVLKRTILDIIYKQFKTHVDRTSSNKFRTTTDTPVSFVYNQFAKKYATKRIVGFDAKSAPNYKNLYVGVWNDFEHGENVTRNAMDLILNYNTSKLSRPAYHNISTVCLNDGFDEINDVIGGLLLNMYETLFPNKQNYEI